MLKTPGTLMLTAVVFAVLASGLFAEGQGEVGAATGARDITLWTTEEQPERMDVQRRINGRFSDLTGINVEAIPVTENQLGERATAAFSAGELPDVIFHPLNFTLGWYDAGILDALSATETVRNLGEDTYAAGALDLVQVDEGYAAVPVGGWTQLILYRQDLFDEAGLQPPTNYQRVRAVIRALHDPPDLYGFVAATDPSQVYMMQVFEEIALANGARIVDEDGNVVVNSRNMRETLQFYKELANASPPGNLYWQQSRELYMGGQAAMIVWSPFILDELAGLRDSVPVTALDDPTASTLAENTGFVTTFAGPGNSDGAGWMDIQYFGITADAAIESAQTFVEYSLTEAYVDTLAMAPEGKFPVRRGVPGDPQKFVQGWRGLSVGVDRQKSLGEIYSADVIQDIIAGLDTGSRWGFPYGYGSLTSRLYDTRIIAELVREYIDGERNLDQTLRVMQQEVQSLME